MSVVQTERLLPVPPSAPLHGLRLLPAPASEPPYDDERPGGQPLPLLPAVHAPLRLVPAPAEPPAEAADATLRPFAQSLVQRLLEALAGLRPMAQLRRDVTPDVYDDLERMVAVRPRPKGTRPDGRSLRSVHVQEQGRVAEVVATVRRGPRYGAIAVRLERTGDRWRCTAVEGA